MRRARRLPRRLLRLEGPPGVARARRDDELLDAIRAIHAESKGTYGWPRIHAELRHRGVRVSRKRVARLMRQAGLSGMVRGARAARTIRVPGVATAPDLVRRDFAPAAPNRLWVADLTEIATWEGKLYLAVVVDCFSRRCVGWAMAEHMRAELVVEALEMAWRAAPAGLVHHSDRGGQYVSLIFGRAAATPASPSRWAPRAAARQRRLRGFFATLKRAHPPALLADEASSRAPCSIVEASTSGRADTDARVLAPAQL